MMRLKKEYTLEQLVEYRNKTLLKARARTKSMNDKQKNYYWYRLDEINEKLNISNKLGVIKMKKSFEQK